MANVIKQLRAKVLDAAWTLHGLPAPTRSQAFDDWLAAGGRGRAFDLPGTTSMVCPPRMMRGDVTAVEPTIAALPAYQRHLYEAEWQGNAIVEFPTDRLGVITDGRTFSNQGLVASSDGVQISDLSGAAFGDAFAYHLVYCGQRIPKPRRIRGSVAVLACGVSQRNYYHWIVEVLPRLRLLEEAGVSPDYYFLPVRYPFHRQSLELLGIDCRKFIGARKYSHLQADELFAFTRPRMDMKPENANYLYQQMAKQSWAKTDTRKRRNVYVARRPCDARFVVNEAEVLAVLKPWNFEKFYLEDLSVQQQIQLFQQADFIIGPHGAGLVNTTFCNPGTRVIEIGTPARASALFYYIAFQRGLTYCNFYGQAVRRRDDESHIRVAPDQLADCVAELLAIRSIAA